MNNHTLRHKNVTSIKFYRDNQLVEEQNPSFKLLKFLYATKLGILSRILLRRKFVARLLGRYYNSRLSCKHIAPFIKTFNINMSEFLVPTGGYRSFNDFFTRPFKPQARHIDANPKHLIAPSDCKVYALSNISTHTLFFVKHQAFDLNQFLKSSSLAQRYENGVGMVFRLAPYDYHRFHFPIACTPSKPTVIKGILESVNPLVFHRGIQPLISNERHLILLETEEYDTVIMIPVGAMMVGTIDYTYTPGKQYNKGDEAGFFAFGGSSVVLLFKQGVLTPRADFIKNSLLGFETAVKMGENINE